MEAKVDKTCGTETKHTAPWGRIVLSALTGLAALAVFLGTYYFFTNRPTDEMAQYAGVYTPYSASADGINASAAGLAELTLELNADGACRAYTGEDSILGFWHVDGGSFSALCGADRLHGVLSGDVLTLENAFGTTASLNLTRNGESDNAADTPVGHYTLTALDDNGREYSGGVLDGTECRDWFIALDSGGEGTAQVFSEEAESITADGKCIILRSMRLSYTLDKNTLTLNYPGGVTLSFEKEQDK